MYISKINGKISMKLIQPTDDKKNFNLWNSIQFFKNYSKTENKSEGPPDLEDLFYKIKRKFFKRNSNKSDYSEQNRFYKYSKYILVFLIIIFLFLWTISGFYTIKEAERGVISRFGKFYNLVKPGLNWKPNFIDNLDVVNVESVREIATSGVMLTSDENVVSVEMNVQYRVTNPKQYLFSVTNADDSLRQATDSALRGVIGRFNMDRILTEGRTIIRTETQKEIEETINPYSMGITILDVNFQAARPPEEVKSSFDDAIAARENREQYVREAEAYANEVQPKAKGKAQRILEEAKSYKNRVVLEAQGEVARFNSLLPQYKNFPEITKNRLYLETMESVLNNSKKIVIFNEKNQITLLPIHQFFNSYPFNPNDRILDNQNNELEKIYAKKVGINKKNKINNIMDKRIMDAKRNDFVHRGD